MSTKELSHVESSSETELLADSNSSQPDDEIGIKECMVPNTLQAIVSNEKSEEQGSHSHTNLELPYYKCLHYRFALY